MKKKGKWEEEKKRKKTVWISRPLQTVIWLALSCRTDAMWISKTSLRTSKFVSSVRRKSIFFWMEKKNSVDSTNGKERKLILKSHVHITMSVGGLTHYHEIRLRIEWRKGKISQIVFLRFFNNVVFGVLCVTGNSSQRFFEGAASWLLIPIARCLILMQDYKY